jgi:hypothetical protein
MRTKRIPSGSGGRRHLPIGRLGILAACGALLSAATITIADGVRAETDAPAPPLPVFTPTPTEGAPNFAFPHNRHQNTVLVADITSRSATVVNGSTPNSTP